ncbi:hypothetical protein NA57DRAFT_62244 [Rhizodiscina lignyota]|uniref:Uncharacterized protein n=1 Tax=Rhizodiscina lignyota TaxID=1504668 RepID=A0A9P4I0J1_9PEZI|nr:hypothetical protein NA57DRAFT_62244 [Rhizodiscina lignyota]
MTSGTSKGSRTYKAEFLPPTKPKRTRLLEDDQHDLIDQADRQTLRYYANRIKNARPDLRQMLYQFLCQELPKEDLRTNSPHPITSSAASHSVVQSTSSVFPQSLRVARHRPSSPVILDLGEGSSADNSPAQSPIFDSPEDEGRRFLSSPTYNSDSITTPAPSKHSANVTSSSQIRSSPPQNSGLVAGSSRCLIRADTDDWQPPQDIDDWAIFARLDSTPRSQRRSSSRYEATRNSPLGSSPAHDKMTRDVAQSASNSVSTPRSVQAGGVEHHSSKSTLTSEAHPKASSVRVAQRRTISHVSETPCLVEQSSSSLKRKGEEPQYIMQQKLGSTTGNRSSSPESNNQQDASEAERLLQMFGPRTHRRAEGTVNATPQMHDRHAAKDASAPSPKRQSCRSLTQRPHSQHRRAPTTLDSQCSEQDSEVVRAILQTSSSNKGKMPMPVTTTTMSGNFTNQSESSSSIAAQSLQAGSTSKSHAGTRTMRDGKVPDGPLLVTNDFHDQNKRCATCPPDPRANGSRKAGQPLICKHRLPLCETAPNAHCAEGSGRGGRQWTDSAESKPLERNSERNKENSNNSPTKDHLQTSNISAVSSTRAVEELKRKYEDEMYVSLCANCEESLYVYPDQTDFGKCYGHSGMTKPIFTQY